jgi:miniconductance mechanosensitive channel
MIIQEARINRAIYLKVSSFVFVMIKCWNKIYAYKRLHPEKEKEIKKSNSTLIDNESNLVNDKS